MCNGFAACDQCTLFSDGSLASVLSQMGRVRSERFHKGRFHYRAQAPVRTRVSRKIDDREPTRKRRVHEDGFNSMDLFRGIYMLTQVIFFSSNSCIYFFNNISNFWHLLEKYDHVCLHVLSFLTWLHIVDNLNILCAKKKFAHSINISWKLWC